MSYPIHKLRALSEQELIDQHDAQAQHTIVGISYFLDELRRREAMASARAANRLAIASMGLSVISVVIAIVALVAR
jgi:hypothetical protein